MSRSIRTLVGLAAASVIVVGVPVGVGSAAHASTSAASAVSATGQAETTALSRHCWWRWVNGRRVRVCRYYDAYSQPDSVATVRA
jgi:hypothetical protein